MPDFRTKMAAALRQQTTGQVPDLRERHEDGSIITEEQKQNMNGGFPNAQEGDDAIYFDTEGDYVPQEDQRIFRPEEGIQWDADPNMPVYDPYKLMSKPPRKRYPI